MTGKDHPLNIFEYLNETPNKCKKSSEKSPLLYLFKFYWNLTIRVVVFATRKRRGNAKCTIDKYTVYWTSIIVSNAQNGAIIS